MIFTLLPLEQQTAEYLWEPAADGAQVPLLLIERTPDEFGLRFPCDQADGGEEGQLFVSSRSPDAVPALVVTGGGSRVVVDVPEDHNELSGGRLGAGVQVGSAGDCTVSVHYRRATGNLILEAGGDRAVLAVPDGAFELTGLHWHSDATDGVRAEVRTSAFSMVRNSLPQKLVLGSILLLALASLLWFLIQRSRHAKAAEQGSVERRSSQARRWRPHAGWWRLRPSEWAMLLVAVTVAVVDLPRDDDGRILARARILANPDLNANVSTLFENRIVPQRWMYEWVLGTSVGWSTNVLVTRLVSVVAVVAAWMLLRRRVLPCLGHGRLTTSVLATAWTVCAAFVVAWSATLRPEPLIILLIVVVLAVTASWPREPTAWPSAVVVATVGLAAATHFSGLAVAFAALPAAVRAFGDLRRSAPPVLTGVAWGTAASLVAMFVGSNLPRTVASATGFDGDAHAYGALDVFRYLSTIDGSTAPMMLATGLAGVGAVVTLAAGIRRLDARRGWQPATAVVLGAALSPFALLFTPSKWLWHLAILAPVAVLGWTLVAQWLDRPRPDRRQAPAVALLALVAAALGLLTAWAMRPAWNPRMLDSRWRGIGLRVLSPDGWAERFPWLVGPDVRWWLWLVLLCAVMAGAALVLRLRRARRAGSAPLAYGLMFCAVVVSVVQLTPPVLDAWRAGQEWTFVRQSVVGLVSIEASCGVPAATPALLRRAAESQDPDSGVRGGAVAGHSSVYFLASCHESMRQRDGVWQVPELLMGELTNDQRRAALEYDVDPIGCHSFPRDRAEDNLCFFQLVADGDPPAPSAIRWHR